jgi:Zn-dependent alcohol dehydrogenase
MSRKQCRRKVWGLGDAVSVAIQGARVIDDRRLAALREVERTALEAFQFGRAEWKHWGAITGVVQAARVLVEFGVGPEVMPTVEQVERFLEVAQARHEATGRLGATGPDLQAVRDLYEYHDLQRTSIDLATYQRAVEKAINRARHAKAPAAA